MQINLEPQFTANHFQMFAYSFTKLNLTKNNQKLVGDWFPS